MFTKQVNVGVFVWIEKLHRNIIFQISSFMAE